MVWQHCCCLDFFTFLTMRTRCMNVPNVLRIYTDRFLSKSNICIYIVFIYIYLCYTNRHTMNASYTMTHKLTVSSQLSSPPNINPTLVRNLRGSSGSQSHEIPASLPFFFGGRSEKSNKIYRASTVYPKIVVLIENMMLNIEIWEYLMLQTKPKNEVVSAVGDADHPLISEANPNGATTCTRVGKVANRMEMCRLDTCIILMYTYIYKCMYIYIYSIGKLSIHIPISFHWLTSLAIPVSTTNINQQQRRQLSQGLLWKKGSDPSGEHGKLGNPWKFPYVNEGFIGKSMNWLF